MSTADLQQRWSAALMKNYGTPKIALVRGAGAVVYDADGNRYVDFLGGIAVNSLGHGHPAILEAVTNQLGTLGHTSNLYANEPVIELAERLLAHFGDGEFGDGHGRAFFCNSGTEANEAAFKMARLTGRSKIVAAEEAFHGRTMGALALTGQASKREPFAPMPPGVVHVPYGDAAALEAVVDDDTAAVFLEPMMGESGVVVPPLDYLVKAREVTARHGTLLILDEVQTGIGRTGKFYAHQSCGIVPDVITLAKGLGGGLPIGAVLATGPAADLLTPACTAPPSAVTRSAPLPRWRSCAPSTSRICSRTSNRWANGSATVSNCSNTPSSTMCVGPVCCWESSSPRIFRPRSRTGREKRAIW